MLGSLSSSSLKEVVTKYLMAQPSLTVITSKTINKDYMNDNARPRL